MEGLAECGHHGTYPGNVWRDIKTKLELEKCDFPEAFICANVPLLDNSKHPPEVTHGEMDVAPVEEMETTPRRCICTRATRGCKYQGSTDLNGYCGLCGIDCDRQCFCECTGCQDEL